MLNEAPFYQTINKEEDVFNFAVELNLPLLLKGPTGSGKSRFLEYMSFKMNRKLITILCNDETSSIDLLGRYIVKGADTIWLDGPLTMGVREGAIVYLDEIAEARPDTIVAIHSLTDHRRTLYLDRKNEEIKASPNFMLVASYNPHYQRSFKELKPSTKQRFISLEFNYPKPELEEKILQGESKISTDIAKKLIKFANLIREKKELSLDETISTRLLVSTALLISKGLPPRLAARVGIIEPLTDDNELAEVLQESFNLYF
jgi:nitric oxide reductase NorQ protein